MSDLIDRQAAIDTAIEAVDYWDGGFSKERDRFMRDALEELPQAEVEPVKRGKWQITEAYPHNVHCSVCHKRFAQTHWAVWEDGSLPRAYCPNCGAKMDGEDE